MDNFTQKFNRILVEAYHNMLLMEEIKRKYSKAGFSFRDRNTIDYLMRFEEGRKISDVADYLKISRPSATALVKKLEKNGLIEKVTDPENERITRVVVTRKGKMFSSYQRGYRERLADRVSENFNEEEQEVLYKGFCELNEFFKDSIRESEEIHK